MSQYKIGDKVIDTNTGDIGTITRPFFNQVWKDGVLVDSDTPRDDVWWIEWPANLDDDEPEPYEAHLHEDCLALYDEATYAELVKLVEKEKEAIEFLVSRGFYVTRHG